MVLPVFKSGKINTLARPATWEFGAFERPTLSTEAASYCNGPSISRSGRRCLAISVAFATFSTSAPVPDVPVEYEIIAIRGSIPKAFAESADWMAISANSSAFGSGLIAQSP